MAATKAVEVDRGKVLAYRVMARQLDRSVKHPDERAAAEAEAHRLALVRGADEAITGFGEPG